MTTSATASGEQARCPSRMLITDLQALKEILDNEDDERAIAIEHGLELSAAIVTFARWADLGLGSRDPIA